MGFLHRPRLLGCHFPGLATNDGLKCTVLSVLFFFFSYFGVSQTLGSVSAIAYESLYDLLPGHLGFSALGVYFEGQFVDVGSEGGSILCYFAERVDARDGSGFGVEVEVVVEGGEGLFLGRHSLLFIFKCSGIMEAN